MLGTQILLLLGGLALIVFGADFLVDGASSLARRLGVSEFVIGLTIVGFGTSCPELVVSLTGAFEGNSSIAAGNVIGSNIFNTLMILGLTAVIFPLQVTRSNRRLDIPITLGVTVLFIAVSLTGSLGRLGGALFLTVFAAYIFFCFKTNKADGQEESPENQPGRAASLRNGLPGQILLIALGLAALVFGGRLLVDSACRIARAAGVGDKFIAVTVLAAGTSLPELATGVVAAFKGKSQLALGNILGSNVFNILLILGASALVSPLSLAEISIVDKAALFASAGLLGLWSYTGKRERIDRWEGAVMLALFAAYYLWLFMEIQ